MTSGLWVLDTLFCASLLGLAWQTLATANLFRAVILFIVFGLMLALTWARLAAPDLALAEAGIGAGLTGVLLLSTLATLRIPPATLPPANHAGPGDAGPGDAGPGDAGPGDAGPGDAGPAIAESFGPERQP